MKELTFTSFDGYRLHCALWEQVKEPKGIIQLIHGMTSYGLRYDDFAKKLNQAGYIVFADDHRGHGLTAGKDKLGQVDKNNFFQLRKRPNRNYKNAAREIRLARSAFRAQLRLFSCSKIYSAGGRKDKRRNIKRVVLYGRQKLILGKIITSLQRLFFGDYKKTSCYIT